MKQKNYYTINFDRLIHILLPAFLRKQAVASPENPSPTRAKILVMMEACLQPLKNLYNRFLTFKTTQEKEARITAQTGLIEKALNDTYDPDARRFEIIHDITREGVVLYTKEDENPPQGMVLYQTSERTNPLDNTEKPGQVLHLNAEGSALPQGLDFRVLAPHTYPGMLMTPATEEDAEQGMVMHLNEDEVSNPENILYMQGDNQAVEIASLVDKYKLASKKFDVKFR